MRTRFMLEYYSAFYFWCFLKNWNFSIFQTSFIVCLNLRQPGSSPDPGCQFPASTSKTNTGNGQKWSYSMNMIDPTCDHWSQSTNIIKLNKTRFFRTLPLSIRCPAHQITYQKTHFLHHFLYWIRPFCEKWIILIYHSSYGNFLEAGNWQNPLCWIRTTSQVALNKSRSSVYLLLHLDSP